MKRTRVKNSVLAWFALPAPVLPPMVMYKNPSGPKRREFGAWLAIALGRPVTMFSITVNAGPTILNKNVTNSRPLRIAIRPEFAWPER